MDNTPPGAVSASPENPGLEYNGQPLKIITIIFLIFNTIAIFLRFFSRLYIKRVRLGWDDVWVVCGWLSITGICICVLISLTVGIGYHQVVADTLWPWTVAIRGRLGLYAMGILYCFAAMFPRLSILALYFRIFSPNSVSTQPVAHYICWALAAIITLTGVVNAIVIGLQCQPIEKAWDPTIQGHCHNIFLHYAWGTVPNIVTDAIMLVLPMPYVLAMNVGNEVKGGLMGVFVLGGVGIVTSTLRFSGFLQTDFALDASWLSVSLYIWTVVEPSTYHISACLVACRPILGAITRKLSIGGDRATRSDGTYDSNQFFFEENNQKQRNLPRGSIAGFHKLVCGDEVSLNSQLCVCDDGRRRSSVAGDLGRNDRMGSATDSNRSRRMSEIEEVAARVARFSTARL